MKKLKFLLCFLLMLATIPINPQGVALELPDIAANAALLVEMNTGNILFAKNENQRINPASTTKIMTTLLAVEAIDRGDIALDDMVTASGSFDYDVSADSSTAGIKTGETMSLENLLYCIMISSANEACNVLGEHLAGGDIMAFYEMMNSRAADLGCSDTHFANTHGLTDPAHYTTAKDLYRITQEAMKYDLFKKLCNATSWQIPPTNMTQEARSYTTTNKMLLSGNKYYYPYAFGVKTGSTDAAGLCLVSTAEKNGVQLMAVVMGAASVTEADNSTTWGNFSESKRLYEWAFSNYSYREILNTTHLFPEIPVKNGSKADAVVLRPAEVFSAFFANDIADEDIEKTVNLYYSEENPLLAPVTEGQVLGQVTISHNGDVYGTVDLVANTDVEISTARQVLYKIRRFFSHPLVKPLIILLVALILFYIFFVIRHNRLRRKRRYRRASYKGKRRW